MTTLLVRVKGEDKDRDEDGFEGDVNKRLIFARLGFTDVRIGRNHRKARKFHRHDAPPLGADLHRAKSAKKVFDLSKKNKKDEEH
jgi:hypothetical protein